MRLAQRPLSEVGYDSSPASLVQAGANTSSPGCVYCQTVSDEKVWLGKSLISLFHASFASSVEFAENMIVLD